MKLYNFTPDNVAYAIDTVNGLYAGNIRFDRAHTVVTRKGYRITGVLRANDSRKYGARLSASGRHTPAVSWEAHRDFMRALFSLNPDGRIQSAFADYRGAGDFEDKYRATQHRQVGSMANPVSFGELSL